MKSKGLCYGCLKKGHMSMKCRNRLKCSLFGRFHLTILHDPTKSSVNMSNHKGEASDSSLAVPKIKQSAAYCSTENSSISACCDTGAGDQTCAMAVIPVRIKLKDKSHSVVTYAFFDSGSSVPDAFAPYDVVTGPSGSPHATETRLGWIVWNVLWEGETRTRDVNRVTIEQYCKCDMKLEELVKASINSDFPERAI